MSESTPVLALPLIQPSQAQKHVTHNEALDLLDLVVQLRLEGVDARVPPAAATEGMVWALGPAPEGDWAGQGGKLAARRGTGGNGGWLFVTPLEGWRAWDKVAGQLRVWTGAAWAAAPDLQNLPGLGIGTSADAQNALAVAAPASLFSHAGAGHQVKINKAATADTASLLYQSGWSGRAELGLAGNNDFSIKTSADGAAWSNALTIEAATGRAMLSRLRLIPGPVPAAPVMGEVYFDAGTLKLRCFDGTSWRNLH